MIELRPSPIYVAGSVLPYMMASLAACASAVFVSPWLVWAGVGLAVMGFFRYLQGVLIRYTFTAETLTVRKGVLAKRIDLLELFRVKDIAVSQSVFERVFGLMTVHLHASDATTPVVRLRGIPRSELAVTLRDRVQQARLRNRVFEVD